MIGSKYYRVVTLGIKSLLLHKLRTGLTMLGMIFGVCSVISMLAIGEGASQQAQDAIRNLGSNNVILRSVRPPDDTRAGSGSKAPASSYAEYGLTYKDAERIQETIPNVARVIPMRLILSSVRFNENNIYGQVIATCPAHREIAHVELLKGRFIADTDLDNAANVCALTAGIAGRLFPYQDPLDQTVRAGADYFRVVGIVREAGAPVPQKTPSSDKSAANSSQNRPLDNNMYVPLSTAKNRFSDGRTQLDQVTVEVRETENVPVAVQQIEALLNRFHARKDFEMVVPLQLLEQAEQTKRLFNIVLGSIAGISLLVGGIGIMNIMLATVTERTREIGVRRALGAKKRDITMQFLVETLVLSVGGGVIGVVLGVAVPFVVSKCTSMPTVVTFWAVLLSFGISGLVGVLFGIYPASRAAALDPIEALRHE